MASTPSAKGNDVEMTVSHSFSTTDQKDELALARLGKKTVLKVSSHNRIHAFNSLLTTIRDVLGSSLSWALLVLS